MNLQRKPAEPIISPPKAVMVYAQPQLKELSQFLHSAPTPLIELRLDALASPLQAYDWALLQRLKTQGALQRVLVSHRGSIPAAMRDFTLLWRGAQRYGFKDAFWLIDLPYSLMLYAPRLAGQLRTLAHYTLGTYHAEAYTHTVAAWRILNALQQITCTYYKVAFYTGNIAWLPSSHWLAQQQYLYRRFMRKNKGRLALFYTGALGFATRKKSLQWHTPLIYCLPETKGSAENPCTIPTWAQVKTWLAP